MKKADNTIVTIHNYIEQNLHSDPNYFINLDKHGNSPLHFMVKDGCFPLVQYLVSRGRDLGGDSLSEYKEAQAIDLSLKNSAGETVLESAKKLYGSQIEGEGRQIIELLSKASKKKVRWADEVEHSKNSSSSWVDEVTNSQGSKNSLTQEYEHVAKYDIQFMKLDFDPPIDEIKQERLNQEKIGIDLFLKAYRENDLKSMEGALLKYDLRIEPTEEASMLFSRAYKTQELKHYGSLSGATLMSAIIGKTLGEYEPVYDMDPLLTEFFMIGFEKGDYDLMSDIITGYEYPGDKNPRAIKALAYAAIEYDYYDMAKTLVKQYNLPLDYVPDDSDQENSLTLGELLADYVHNNYSRSPSPELKSFVDTFERERIKAKQLSQKGDIEI